ncbi:hypothetical protein FA15DRAFT_661010 [Coprinopsis marcescibilis]|uniref:DUF5648 domain-containing protein n=1 Tax=Coprinopsis marcescibilis TaxID=230819 RepID=A0A5C3KDK8_COPMA|nr:hypothetical protein FA15DRAFT_661010 [Coprinopsis marcescibilis]
MNLVYIFVLVFACAFDLILASPVNGTSEHRLVARQDLSCGQLSTRSHPLFRANHPGEGDWLFSISAAELTEATRRGYVFNSALPGIGKVWLVPETPDMIPLFRLWSNAIFDHLYTTDVTEMNTAINGPNKYQVEQILYVYQNRFPCPQNPNIRPVALYRLYHFGRRNHMLAGGEAERDKAIFDGFSFIRLEGFMFPPP